MAARAAPPARSRDTAIAFASPCGSRPSSRFIQPSLQPIGAGRRRSRARSARRNASGRDRARRRHARTAPRPPVQLARSRRIAGMEREEAAELRPACAILAKSPRRPANAGSPTGATCRSPSAAPRWMMKTKRRSVAAWPAPCCGQAEHRERAGGAGARGTRRRSSIFISAGIRARQQQRERPRPGFRRAPAPCAVAGLRRREAASARAARASTIAAGPARDPLRRLDPAHQRVGAGPAGGDIVIAGGRARASTSAGRAGSAARRPPAARQLLRADARASAETDQSHGVLNLAAGRRPGFGRSRSARDRRVGRSPPLAR